MHAPQTVPSGAPSGVALWPRPAPHAPCHPLDGPGTADLTAHVDFGALAQAAAPARASGLTDQAVLLARLGIGARAHKLSLGLTGEALQSHLAATQRLTPAPVSY